MARDHQCSVTEMIEDLARDAEYSLKYDRMTPAQRKTYEAAASDLDYLDRRLDPPDSRPARGGLEGEAIGPTKETPKFKSTRKGYR
jgi:hypothetical protein